MNKWLLIKFLDVNGRVVKSILDGNLCFLEQTRKTFSNGGVVKSRLDGNLCFFGTNT
jgi:hypothetical protein